MANVTPAQFRTTFSAFANTSLYTDATISFWIGLAYLLMDAARWGTLLDYGVQLFVAHNLSLAFNDLAGTTSGQSPGAVMGPITSANVDKVGYSRDSSAAMDPKNGHWNLSTFGLRYIQLVRMIGAGPVQVGAPYGPATAGYGNYANGAWPGVITPLGS